MKRKSYFFEKHPALTLVFLILAVSFMVDGLLGALLIPSDFKSFRTRHYYFHHGLRPDQTTFARWNSEVYPFFTNSLGLRDATPRHIEKSIPNRRLLIIGDSHTEGVDLPFEDTFAGILAKAGDSSGTDVLNGAVISYSPKIYYLKLKYLLEIDEIKVDEVFCLIDISDIQNELVYEKFEPEKPETIRKYTIALTEYLKRNSFSFYAINKIINDKGRKEFFSRIEEFNSSENTGNPFNTSSADLYYSFFSHFSDKIMLSNPRFHGVGEWLYDDNFRKLAEKGILLGQKNIKLMKDLCDRHYVRLTIGVHPWYSQLYRRNPEDLYVTSWKEFAMKNNIGFINLYPLFINKENPEIVFKKYYIKGDNHWNAAGHARVAAYLSERLNIINNRP